MKVVLDTNIYLSGMVFPDSSPGKVLELARRRDFETYCSQFILEEIEKNLVLKFQYSENWSKKVIDEILKFVIIIKSKKRLKIITAKDDDNRILETAIDSKANFLISGDKKHILCLKKIDQVEIISAREFLVRTGVL